ncbi:CDON protein, partial [Crypturellus undulatus]|nr:CDON protein [Crypturellus undulatus]
GGSGGGRGGDVLYLAVGSVLGVMVLILLAFIAMCLCKSRPPGAAHSESGPIPHPASRAGKRHPSLCSFTEYEPPGYLYHGAGQLVEYAALAGASGAGAAGFLGACPHARHKADGAAGLFPGHGGSHGRPCLDYDHPHALANGGLYAALPPSDIPERGGCRNCRNNNR